MDHLAALLFPRADAAPTTSTGAVSTNAPFGASPGTPLPTDYCALKYAGLTSGPIPDQGQRSLAAIWSLVALSTLFLALRIYCKIWRLRKLWWDDWVCFVIDGAMSQRAVDLGFGRYPCDIDPRNFPLIGLEGQNIGATFGMFAVVWSKTSFAITLLRLTEGKTKAFIWCIIVSMNIIFFLEALFVWVQCTPISKTWLPSTPGTCWGSHPVNVYGVFAGCFSGVCDIILALLPWRLVWSLQMQKKEKIGVGIAMSMGVFAGATAFVKSHMILTLGTSNFSYDGCELLVWAAAEIATTIMAACIPILRVFVREVRERTIARSGALSNNENYYYKRKVMSGTGGSGASNSHTSSSTRPRSGLVFSAPAISLAAAKPPLSPPLSADDSSEKHILPIVHEDAASSGNEDSSSPSGSRKNVRIVRTQEYAVEYRGRGRDSSDAGNVHELRTLPNHAR
ncbi:hypothetical protein B0T26DRAFT_648687 [Lasiosphaeria miniovina]|uniref:Rhodopsin domain-containing protein n=1 Tax=Lasiosphaeria miniovina TaxID=1954250 RepID=A0AA40AB54_9PEZI|nr:uncharacterized protein B0T26DRAFT_648687 [Lasiosphaeria miniovina]KAK0712393.1 hypothetical protein B0T26DRAFT_648687 [Lasiosphaeria miniovina]